MTTQITLIGIYSLFMKKNRTGYWIIVSVTLVFEEVFKSVTTFIPYILGRSFILFLCLYNDGAEHFLNNYIIPGVSIIHQKLFPSDEKEGNNKNYQNSLLSSTTINVNKKKDNYNNANSNSDLSNLPSLPKNRNIKDAAVAVKELLKDEDENGEEECCNLPVDVTDVNEGGITNEKVNDGNGDDNNLPVPTE